MVVRRSGIAGRALAFVLPVAAGACASGGDAGGAPSGYLTPRTNGSSSGIYGSSSGTYYGDDGSTTTGDDSGYAAATSSGAYGNTSSGFSGTTSGTGTSSSSSGSTGSGSTGSSGSGSSSTGASSTSSGASEEAGPAPSGFSLLYQCQITQNTSAYIGAVITVVNGSVMSVPLSSVTVRYYYTDEVHMTPNVVANWAHVSTPSKQDQSASFSTTIGTLSPAATGADAYIQFSFSAPSSLEPGQSIVFSWQLDSPNPSSGQYSQTNDYSFNASDTTATAWDHIVVFVSGSVAYGVVPT